MSKTFDRRNESTNMSFNLESTKKSSYKIGYKSESKNVHQIKPQNLKQKYQFLDRNSMDVSDYAS